MSLSVTRAWFQPSACACEIYSLLRLFAKQGIAKYLTKLVVELQDSSLAKFQISNLQTLLISGGRDRQRLEKRNKNNIIDISNQRDAEEDEQERRRVVHG